MQLPWLADHSAFPPTAQAMGEDSEVPGLLAAGGGLATERLVAAYRRGIFPWYGEGQPVLWWSPNPRMVLPTSAFKLSRSLRKTVQRFLANEHCELRFDHDFRQVIESCAAAPREGQNGTWIVHEMVDAYLRLHQAGLAHSVETWIDGELVGGLYGIGIGRMVYGESMFARRTDASKIALTGLVAFCRAQGMALIDCQQHTRHLASFGARAIARSEFEAHLASTVDMPAPAWTYDRHDWTHLGLTPDPKAGPPPTDPPVGDTPEFHSGAQSADIRP